jgi:hypothetical protein
VVDLEAAIEEAYCQYDFPFLGLFRFDGEGAEGEAGDFEDL